MSATYDGSDSSLATISQDGEIPECRLKDASAAQQFARRLRENDCQRSYKRSKVDGLVGGFPPYRQSKLRDNGLSQNCNANFMTASSYMENGAGAFNDLTADAPGCVGIKTSHGTDEQRDEYSRVMSGEADLVFLKDPLRDYEMQRSQWEMVLHGCGPLFFEDAFKVFPRSVACGDLKVAERTRSDIQYYDAAVIDIDYYPPEIYAFIRNPEAAAQVGWRVDYTKKCLANAMNIQQQRGLACDWTFYEQQLKAQSLEYVDETKIVQLSYVFSKEFDGTISQGIVEREPSGASSKEVFGHENTDVQYLFFHKSRYQNWSQALHAMYFDRGNGGFHHTVTGLGVKMYSAMEFENRLICRLMDGAFAPKVLFRPTTTEMTQKMQLAHMGDYGVVPAGWEATQMPINGFINEGLAMQRASSELMRSNLSNYRQPVQQDRPGNPETKYGRMLDASQAGSLSKTTFNRYYRQLDHLYAEIVRRLCNINSTDERAITYQKRCMDKGVPKECFGRIESVEAIRVVGEGNAIMRKASLMEMAQFVTRMPEDGQNNWFNDMIASMAGSRSVDRYNPPKKRTNLQTDQTAGAMLQVAAMKVGVRPIITSSQNPLTYAGVFLSACTSALQSLQNGADPHGVVAFVDLAAPACIAQLKRVANDPLRKQAVQQMGKQIEQVGKILDQLKKKLGEQQQQQQAQRQKTQDAMSDQQIKAMKVKGDLQLKAMKLKAQMGERAVRTRQDLSLNDARTASQIHNQNRLAAFQE